MIGEASEAELRRALATFVAEGVVTALRSDENYRGMAIEQVDVSDADFHTIRVQLRALGLIEQSTRARSVKDTATYWTLTAFGDDVMMKLRAVRRVPIAIVSVS